MFVKNQCHKKKQYNYHTGERNNGHQTEIHILIANLFFQHNNNLCTASMSKKETLTYINHTGECISISMSESKKQLKDDQTEENTLEILQHSDKNINNS